MKDMIMKKIALIAFLTLAPCMGVVMWLAAAEEPVPYQDQLLADTIGGWTGTKLRAVVAHQNATKTLPIRLAEGQEGNQMVNVMTPYTTKGQSLITLATSLGMEARLDQAGVLLCVPGSSAAGRPLADVLKQLGLVGYPPNACESQLDLSHGGVQIDSTQSRERWIIDVEGGRVAWYKHNALIAWWTCSMSRMPDTLMLMPTGKVHGPLPQSEPYSFVLQRNANDYGNAFWFMGNASSVRLSSSHGRVLVPVGSDNLACLEALKAERPLLTISIGRPTPDEVKTQPPASTDKPIAEPPGVPKPVLPSGNF